MAVVVYVPSRLGEGFFTDLAAPGAGDDAKAITYNHNTQAFVYAAASATPPGSDTQVIFNDAGAYGADAGMTYDAANDRLTVIGGIIAGDWSPPSDSTTAVSIWNAARSARVMTVDTMNNIMKLPNQLWIGDPSSNPNSYAQYVYKSNSYAISAYATGLSSGFAALYMNNDLGDNAQCYLVQYGSTTSYTPLGQSSANWSALFANGGNNAGLMLATLTSKPMLLGTNNAEAMRIDSSQRVMIGQVSATALLDIAASTTARASSRERAGTAPSAPNDGDRWNDGNAYAMMVNGTNAVNTDGGLSVWMQSSTTARNVGRVLWQYTDKTDATRVTEGSVTAYYQSTEHKAIRWRGGSSGPLLSFYDVATPIARQVLATGASATPDDIIAVLQALGLVKQS